MLLCCLTAVNEWLFSSWSDLAGLRRKPGWLWMLFSQAATLQFLRYQAPPSTMLCSIPVLELTGAHEEWRQKSSSGRDDSHIGAVPSRSYLPGATILSARSRKDPGIRGLGIVESSLRRAIDPLVAKELQGLSAGHLDAYPTERLTLSICGDVRKGIVLVVHLPLAGIQWNRDRGAMRPTRAGAARWV